MVMKRNTQFYPNLLFSHALIMVQLLIFFILLFECVLYSQGQVLCLLKAIQSRFPRSPLCLVPLIHVNMMLCWGDLSSPITYGQPNHLSCISFALSIDMNITVYLERFRIEFYIALAYSAELQGFYVSLSNDAVVHFLLFMNLIILCLKTEVDAIT